MQLSHFHQSLLLSLQWWACQVQKFLEKLQNILEAAEHLGWWVQTYPGRQFATLRLHGCGQQPG
eukprot:82273-Alexandrium_andersonii.AAC.1